MHWKSILEPCDECTHTMYLTKCATAQLLDGGPWLVLKIWFNMCQIVMADSIGQSNVRHGLELCRHIASEYQSHSHMTIESWDVQWTLKGKSSPNYHNFKRKSKNFPTDWYKNYENRIRNKEVVTFWNFTFFRKTFLDQSLWIFKWVKWCHHLTIFYTCHLQKWQKSHTCISAMRM